MGQKVHPIGFRLGFNRHWNSHWYNPMYSNDHGYTNLLKEDFKISHYIKSSLRHSRLITDVPKIYRKSGHIYILLNLNFIKIYKKKRFKFNKFRTKYKQRSKFNFQFKEKFQKKITPLKNSLNLTLENSNKTKNFHKLSVKKKNNTKKTWKFKKNRIKFKKGRLKHYMHIEEFKKFQCFNSLNELKRSFIFKKFKTLKPKIKTLKKKLKKLKKFKTLQKLKLKLQKLNNFKNLKIKSQILKLILNKLIFYKTQLNKFKFFKKSKFKKFTKNIKTLKKLKLKTQIHTLNLKIKTYNKHFIKLKFKVNLLINHLNLLKLKINKLNNFNQWKLVFQLLKLNKLKKLKLKLNKLKNRLNQFKKFKTLNKELINSNIFKKLEILILNLQHLKLKLLKIKSNSTNFLCQRKKNPWNKLKINSLFNIKKIKDRINKRNTLKIIYEKKKKLLKKKLKLKKVTTKISKIRFNKKVNKYNKTLNKYNKLKNINAEIINQRLLKIKSNLKFITNSKVKLFIKQSRKKYNIPYNTFYLGHYLSTTLSAPKNKRKFVFLYYKLYRNLRTIANRLNKRKHRTKKIKGFRMKYAGKLWSKGRSKNKVVSYGAISSQNISEIMDYQFVRAITKYGVTGLKIWLNYHPRKHHKKNLRNSIKIHYKPFLYLLHHKKTLKFLKIFLFYIKKKLKKKILQNPWKKNFYLLQNNSSKIQWNLKNSNKKVQ